MGSLSLSEEWMEVGVGRKWGEGEDGRERKVEMICQIRLF